DDGSWISSAYLVGQAVVIPLTGWLSRSFSVRRFMIGDVVLFLSLTFFFRFVRDLHTMIALRAFQGVTGGGLIPPCLMLIITLLPPSRKGTGLALYAFMATLGQAAGPALGGWLAESFGWPWIFRVSLLPGALMIGLLWISLERRPMQLGLLRQGDWL